MAKCNVIFIEWHPGTGKKRHWIKIKKIWIKYEL